MYHRISSVECPVEDPEEVRYAVDLDAFRRQLDAVERAGARAVSMREVHDLLEGGGVVPGEWVAMTFDDGNRSDFVHAAPLLRERGFSATFYVCGARVDAPDGLERDMLREMTDQGMHVASHGMTHRFLSTLDADDEHSELERSRDLLGGLTGEVIDHFSPPGGRYTRRTMSALDGLGYRAMATSDFGLNRTRGGRFRYRRIPLMRTTSLEHFERIISARRAHLLGDYARALVLRSLRSVLGERGYRRLRGAGLGD
jgi:peptidoglycan/xylan/chitin deacetylase (PgdA/CDA1 family)